MINGTRVTGDINYFSDYLDVTITIRKPNDSNTTIASGLKTVGISGASLRSVTLSNYDYNSSSYYNIELENGIISGNTIEYTVSGYYNSNSYGSNSGGTTYPSKTITFTKQ